MPKDALVYVFPIPAHPTCSFVHSLLRRAVHKGFCSSENLHPNDITVKLVKRLFVAKHLRSLLTYHSILNLDLLTERTNSNRFVVNMVCTTAPADTNRPDSEGINANERVRLVISSIRRVPLEEAPLPAQKLATETRAKQRRDPTTNMLVPIVTTYFTCSEGHGRHLAFSVEAFTVYDRDLEYMAKKIATESSTFGTETGTLLNTQTLLM